MRMVRFNRALAVMALALVPARSMADCSLVKFFDLPVAMSGLKPVAAAKINGVDAAFVVDSGLFYSMITPASAARHGLRLHAAPDNLTVEGVGGNTGASIAYVDELALGDRVLRRIEFLVGGSEMGSGAAGLLGRNVLGVHDAEYDLAHGVIRLMQPGVGCRKNSLAYWAGQQPVSVIDIDWATGPAPAIASTAYLNGKRIHVVFDTGTGSSFLARRAAERVGFAPDGAGVVAAGSSHGIASRPYQTWIATFPSFKVGDEEILNARLRVGDADLPQGDMLLGADFFLSHRIYVAKSQGKLYFTYNGGPVFDLRRPAPNQGAESGPPDADGARNRPAAKPAGH